MDEAWRKARLEELWESLLPASPGVNEAIDPRVIRALETLRLAREEHTKAETQGSDVGMFRAVSDGRLAWQLLSLEIGAVLRVFSNTI